MTNSATDISETLRRAVSQTLENLAFTEVHSREESSLTGPRESYDGSRIALGTMGTLHMVIMREFLQEIAGLLFNSGSGSGSLDADILRDAQLEILNMIAGRFLDGMFQDKSDFIMGLPEPHLVLGEWNALPVRLILIGEGGKEIAIGLGPDGRDGNIETFS